jgi:hypothetical protein
VLGAKHIAHIILGGDWSLGIGQINERAHGLSLQPPGEQSGSDRSYQNLGATSITRQ